MSAQRVGDELRREPAPRERGARREGGGDAAHVVAPAQRVGSERHRGQGGQRAGQRPTADVVCGRSRSDGGQAADADDDRGHREHVAGADGLAERARAQHEQQHEAERECGLHDGERSEQQRGGLQRPAEQPERGAGKPARAPRQAPDQRRSQPMSRRHRPSLERLQGDAEVVEQGGRARCDGAEQDGGHGSSAR
jgi:hypothetical protein